MGKRTRYQHKKTKRAITPAKAGIHSYFSGPQLSLGLRLFFIAFTLFSFPVAAQEAPSQGAPAAGMHTLEVSPGPKNPFAGYAPLDLTGLFNLYWKAGVAKPENTDTITEYIQTTSCDLYAAKYKDDFAWPEILKATTAYVKNYSPRFPSQFMVIQPVGLGRYLPDKQVFEITNSTQYKTVSAAFFADYTTMPPPCTKGSSVGLPATVPLRAIVKLDEPFSLTQIPMSPTFAKQAIDMMDLHSKGITIEGEKNNRFAYVRFYYTITAFERVGDGKDGLFDGLPAAMFLGTMDGYEIFADQQGQLPMYQWKKEKKAD